QKRSTRRRVGERTRERADPGGRRGVGGGGVEEPARVRGVALERGGGAERERRQRALGERAAGEERVGLGAAREALLERAGEEAEAGEARGALVEPGELDPGGLSVAGAEVEDRREDEERGPLRGDRAGPPDARREELAARALLVAAADAVGGG